MTTVAPDTTVDDEEALGGSSTDAYLDLLSRLSHQSVVKHFDAYADIAWDDLEMTIDRRPLGAVRRRCARRHRLVPGSSSGASGPPRPRPRGFQDEDRAAVREHPQAGAPCLRRRAAQPLGGVPIRGGGSPTR